MEDIPIACKGVIELCQKYDWKLEKLPKYSSLDYEDLDTEVAEDHKMIVSTMTFLKLFHPLYAERVMDANKFLCGAFGEERERSLLTGADIVPIIQPAPVPIVIADSENDRQPSISEITRWENPDQHRREKRKQAREKAERELSVALYKKEYEERKKKREKLAAMLEADTVAWNGEARSCSMVSHVDSNPSPTSQPDSPDLPTYQSLVNGGESEEDIFVDTNKTEIYWPTK